MAYNWKRNRINFSLLNKEKRKEVEQWRKGVRTLFCSHPFSRGPRLNSRFMRTVVSCESGNTGWASAGRA